MRTTIVVLALALLAVPAFASITGIVMTPDGAPVSGARVSIYALETPDARHARLLSSEPEAAPLASVQTDAKGAFSFDSPKEATVDLRVYARGFMPREQVIERDADTGALALAKTELRSGTITAAGKPVANAVVSILYDAYEYIARTNEAGRYEAPDFKRARGIAVVHPDFAPSEETFPFGVPPRSLDRTLTPGITLEGRTTTGDGTTPVAKAAVLVDGWPLAVSADDGSFTISHAPAKWTLLAGRKELLIGTRAYSAEAAQVIRMTKSASISGRAIDAKTKLPVAGVVIRVGQRRSFMVDTPMTATTDAKGAYTMLVPPGTYMLWPSHPAYDANPMDVNVAPAQAASRDVSLDPLARVSGVVTDESKKPVAAASVSQEESREAFFRGGPIRMMRATSVVSGPDGRFSIRTHGEEEFRLRANKKGFPAASSDAIKVAPGDRRSGVVITIPSGVAVTGRVTDRQNNPLSGIAVRASETQSGSAGRAQRMIFMGMPQDEDEPVRTASDGTFAMRVKEGAYDFSFKGDGYAPATVRAQQVSANAPNFVETALDPAVSVAGRVTRGGTGVEGVRVMTFSGGDTVVTAQDGSFEIGNLAPGPLRVMLRKENDFIDETRTLEAPAHDVSIELPAGSRVSGHVYEKGTHKPVTSFQAGISVSRSGGGMIMMAPPQMQSFTSDDGSFALEHVPPGAKTVIASAPGFASARMSVNVEENKAIENLELELDAGVKLSGRVTSPNGTPVADATVRLAPSSTGAFASGGDRRTMTDSNGEYVLDALEPGDEAVEFSHPKYLGTRKEVTLKGRDVRLDAQLSAGQRVVGTVVTESGSPVPDAEVEAGAAGGSMRMARTDANGTFTMESLSPARYRFTAAKNGFAEGTLEDFDVTSGAQPRIVMRNGGVIYGHVNGLTAQELANTTVEAHSGSSSSSTPVDASGNYRLEGAPSGTVSVAAMTGTRDFTRRRTSGSVTVEVSPGGSAQVDLDFHSETVIRGRVTRNGRPLSGASILFNPQAGRTQASAAVPTDEQGNYSVSGLDEGDYNVSVLDMQRMSPYATKYHVSGSATFDIDFDAGGVRGRVVDATSNEGLAAANVQLRSTDNNVAFRGARVVITDASGAFAFDSVPAGSYVLNASKDAYGNQALDVTVTDSGSDGLELRLARSEGVSMRVVDGRDGRTLRAMVSVLDPSGRVVYESPMMFGGVDEATEIKLPIAAGTYDATVMSIGYAPRTVSFRSPSSQVVALTPGGTIAIHSKHREPARVRLIDASGAFYPRAGFRPPITSLSPSPGTTTIENVAPGAYTLQLLDNDDTVLDQQKVVVTEGGVAEAEI